MNNHRWPEGPRLTVVGAAGAGRRTSTLLLGLALACLPAAALTAGASLERFFGKYEGASAATAGGGSRDLSVTISPQKDGFLVEWRAQAGGQAEVFSVPFRATRRKNIYASAMRRDLFGNPVSMNPIEGQPFIWATLAGDTLIVHVSRITDSGAQELEIYKRTLVAQGMDVEFTQLRDAEPIERIRGTLKRIGAAPAAPAPATPVPGWKPEN